MADNNITEAFAGMPANFKEELMKMISETVAT